jgi:ABC-type branched-subunit amino acid transport system substrate-binding protein
VGGDNVRAGVGQAGAPTGRAPVSQGVTAKTIAIGVEYYENVEKTGRSLGIQYTYGAQKAQAEAIIKYVNAHGGIAGRQVVPVFHAIDRSDFDLAAAEEAACSDFTEDHKVFAAMLFNDHFETYPACIAKRNTVVIQLTQSKVYAQEFFDRWPSHYYTPGQLNLDHIARPLVEGIASVGYFEKGAKLGLVRGDTPAHERATNEVLKPALAAYGQKIDEEAPLTFGDLSVLPQQISNAILRFRTANVTHVIFYGFSAFFWMAPAESQGYRPRYAINSTQQPAFLTNMAPQEQLRRAVGIGWMPSIDVPREYAPKANPTRSLCLDALRKAGQRFTDPTAETSALGYCDDLLFLKAALDRADDLTPAGFRRSVEALGARYESPLVFATRFGPRRHDGPSAVRVLSFNSDCPCFVYVGGTRSVG